MRFKEKEMSNIMDKTFILENITPPVFRDGKEIHPPGYIIFPSLRHYKNIKNLDRIMSHFMKIYDKINNKKVNKCLDLIFSLLEKCGTVKLYSEDETNFDTAYVKNFVIVFPGIVKFVEMVRICFGYGEKKDNPYNLAIDVMFDDDDDDEIAKVKTRYCFIVQILYDQNICPFGLF